LFRKLNAPSDRARYEREMSDEMRFHVEMETDDLISRGMSPEAARRQALATFGGEQRFKEEGHVVRGSHWLVDLAQDLRYAGRSLLHNRGYAVVALLTLALGVGATTTIFGVVNGVLVKPMPFRSPDKLLLLWDDMSWIGVKEAWVTGPEVVELRASLKGFEGVSAVLGSNAGLVGDGGEPEQLSVTYTSANFFELLGTHPALGRGFNAGEDEAGAGRVAVISNGLWRRRFGASPSIVGKPVSLNGTPYTVVGVLPAHAPFSMEQSLGSPLRIDVYAPLQVDLATEPRDAHRYGVLARVRDDVTVAQGLAELATVSKRQDEEVYKHNFRFAPIGLRERVVRTVRPALLALMAAVVVLVLIMSANLATLALARSARREREFAIRKALGAARSRIARQVFTETIALATAGAAGGALLAQWGMRGLLALAPAGLPRRDEVGIDFVVLGFTLGIGVCIGLVIGLAPVVQSVRRDLTSVMREKAASQTSSHDTRSTLVLVQVALSLVLLAGTGVLLSSFLRLMTVDPGFDARHAVAVTLRANPARYPSNRAAAFVQDGLDRLAAIPGVQQVGATTSPPLSADADQYSVGFPDSPINSGERRHDALLVDYAVATPGYFRAMAVPLLEGRDFGPQDDSRSAPVAIIDDPMARHFYPNGSAVGKQIRIYGDTVATVIGVVRQVRLYTIQEEGRPQVYRPENQVPASSMTFVLRGTAIAPASVERSARAAFKAIDPLQPIISIDPMTRIVALSLAERRLVLVLVSVFGATALLLAALGVYGVTSAAVAQRTRELGIRMALGAQSRDVIRLVLRRPMGLMLAGVVIGTAGTIALAGVTRRLLYQASPTDPRTLAIVTGVLAMVAFVAGYLPARRAARVDPASVLRAE
jgi:predicted permease